MTTARSGAKDICLGIPGQQKATAEGADPLSACCLFRLRDGELWLYDIVNTSINASLSNAPADVPGNAPRRLNAKTERIKLVGHGALSFLMIASNGNR